jgi:hypothetical protein
VSRCALTAADVAEVRRFERLLRIFGRIDREGIDDLRKVRRRRAACRLVYGDDVDRWPGYREAPPDEPATVTALFAERSMG